MKSISEKTQITVGLLIALLGGVGWLTDLRSNLKVANESIKHMSAAQDKLSASQDNLVVKVHTIDTNVAEIRGELKRLGQRRQKEYVQSRTDQESDQRAHEDAADAGGGSKGEPVAAWARRIGEAERARRAPSSGS
jgi:chromosome segregation ATPase